MNFDHLVKQLDQAQKALARLDGTLTNVSFDPNQPASVHAAIAKMEGAVDACVSPWRSNPLVKELVAGIKEHLAEEITSRAAAERANAIEGEEMDTTIFRQVENTVNDLRWSDMNTFPRHIRKLSRLLQGAELGEISAELVGLVDLDAWLKAGEATQSGLVGSARLEWPEDHREELGMTIALIHHLAEEPEQALQFSHTFYNTGNQKITPELQGMVAQVIVPFARDFIDYVKEVMGVNEPAQLPQRAAPAARKVFVVHGHNEAAKEAVARFLEKLEFETIILHEQASQGVTIIEKIEAHGDVGYAVVLLTPDDVGGANGAQTQPRARQNVILELGYFIGRLGRSRVTALKQGDLEVPSDFGGVVHEAYDQAGAWRQALGRELAAAGFEIDWNKIMNRA